MRKASCARIRLTWSLPPHSPLPGFSGGLTSKIRHDHCRLADQLTWSPLPVSGMALQPQTQAAALPSVYFVFSVCSRSKGHTIHCLCPCGFNYFWTFIKSCAGCVYIVNKQYVFTLKAALKELLAESRVTGKPHPIPDTSGASWDAVTKRIVF